MSYHPSDDYPDIPAVLSAPGHALVVDAHAGSRVEPGSVDAYCLCGDWDFWSVESIGGPAESPMGAFDDHIREVS